MSWTVFSAQSSHRGPPNPLLPQTLSLVRGGPYKKSPCRLTCRVNSCCCLLLSLYSTTWTSSPPPLVHVPDEASPQLLSHLPLYDSAPRQKLRISLTHVDPNQRVRIVVVFSGHERENLPRENMGVQSTIFVHHFTLGLTFVSRGHGLMATCRRGVTHSHF